MIHLRKISPAQLRQASLSLALLFSAFACTNQASETKAVQSGPYKVTGRTSMAAGAATQCVNQGYDAGSDTYKGHPIAGVDGKTLGTISDGSSGDMCGKCVKTSGGDTYAVVDRIWENDGQGGGKYNDKGNADNKSGATGEGYNQIDISANAFNDKHGGHNPPDVTLEATGC